MSKNQSKEIVIILDDLIQNDFNLALQSVKNSLSQEFPNNLIMVTATGEDFFKQCVPSN